MKKTIIITATAFIFSLSSINAMTKTETVIPSHGYELNIKYSVSSFCVAVVKGDLETVKKLIDLGEDVNQKSKGMTPAMYAAKFNRVEVLKLLIEKGANLKARSDSGKTAMHYAKATKAKETYSLIKEVLNKKK